MKRTGEIVELRTRLGSAGSKGIDRHVELFVTFTLPLRFWSSVQYRISKTSSYPTQYTLHLIHLPQTFLDTTLYPTRLKGCCSRLTRLHYDFWRDGENGLLVGTILWPTRFNLLPPSPLLSQADRLCPLCMN